MVFLGCVNVVALGHITHHVQRRRICDTNGLQQRQAMGVVCGNLLRRRPTVEFVGKILRGAERTVPRVRQQHPKAVDVAVLVRCVFTTTVGALRNQSALGKRIGVEMEVRDQIVKLVLIEVLRFKILHITAHTLGELPFHVIHQLMALLGGQQMSINDVVGNAIAHDVPSVCWCGAIIALQIPPVGEIPPAVGVCSSTQGA